MAQDRTCDVLIVGAGPTGSALALFLAQQGVRVLIADKAADIYPLPRAAHIDHETVRIFQALGIYIGSGVAAAQAKLAGDNAAVKVIAEEARADLERVLSPELFSQRLARLRAVAKAAAAPDPNQSSAETARLARRPRIEFDGAVGKDPCAQRHAAGQVRHDMPVAQA